MATVPSVPTPPSNTDPAMRRFLNAVKSVLDAYIKPGAEVVTQKELTSFGDTVTESIVGSSTTPPKLSGLSAFGSLSFVILTWDKIPYGDHSYTIIYRAAVDDQSQAVQIGTSRTLIYADHVPGSENYYYWIRTVSKANVLGPFNQLAGTVGSASLDPTYSLEVLDNAITAEQIVAGAITADKMAVVELAALAANLGTVTAGLMQSPDGTFIVDLNNKQILITGPNGQASDDYTVIQNGVIESYKWAGGTHLLNKALSLIESGTAENNTVVQIPGYFETEPKIIVSPKSIQVYDSTNPGQDQVLECGAESITEYSPGRWEFTAKASLVFGGSAGTASPNWANGDTSLSSINSPTYTLPASSTDVTVNISMKSFRGTGTAPYYRYRAVTWKLYYRAVGSGTWILANSKTKYPGATLGYVNDSITFTFASAGDYEFYVNATYSDYTGTFSSGTGGYEYDSVVKTAANAYEVLEKVDEFSAYDITQNVTVSLPAYSPPAGWEIYTVTYQADIGYYLQIYNHTADNNLIARADSLRGNIMISRSGQAGERTSGVEGASNTVAQSATESSYNTGYLSGLVKIYSSAAKWTDSKAELRINNPKATIGIRKPIINSTTATNDLKVNSYDYTLSGFSQISTGTLNWMAIGR